MSLLITKQLSCRKDMCIATIMLVPIYAVCVLVDPFTHNYYCINDLIDLINSESVSSVAPLIHCLASFSTKFINILKLC